MPKFIKNIHQKWQYILRNNKKPKENLDKQKIKRKKLCHLHILTCNIYLFIYLGKNLAGGI